MKKTNSVVSIIAAVLSLAVIFGIPAVAIVGANKTLPLPEKALAEQIEETTGSTVVATGASAEEVKANIEAELKRSAQREADRQARLAEYAKIAEEKAKAKKDEEVKEEKVEEAKQDEAGEVAQDTGDVSAPGEGNGGSANGGSSPASAPVQSSAGTATTPSTPARAEHVHSPATRWVSNPVDTWVVDQAAWDEVVPGYSILVASDGSEFYDYDSYAQYNREHNGSLSVSVDTHPGYTIHHDEVGHWETTDNGYNESYCSTCGTTL